MSKRSAFNVLKELVLQSWDDTDALPELMASAELDRTGIDFGGDARNVWYRVLLGAVQQDRLHELIEIAWTRNKGIEKELKQALADFDAVPGSFWIPPEDPQAFKLNSKNPYPGLRRFEESDQDRFFGRDKETRDLLNASRESALILVLGHSGSGKSSVVRAGMIPQWRNSQQQTSQVLVFTPDVNPFESLYRSIPSHIDQQVAVIAREPSRTKFVDLMTKVGQPDEAWIVFVDQFEETFTRVKEKNLRDTFIASLVDASRANDPRLRIVLAMRDDFFGQLRDYQDLFRITDQQIQRVIEMDEDSLREVIERPAAEHGVGFDGKLVDDVVAAVLNRRGMLPLMQFALNDLWKRERLASRLEQRLLTRGVYDGMGGVLGALRDKVQAVFRSLSPEDRRALRRIMLCTVEISELETGVQPVSRRSRRSELVNQSDLTLLDRLINVEKLLVAHGDENPQFELPHEAMIQAWPDFSRWVEESQESIRLRNQLNHDVEIWLKVKADAADASRDELWRGSRLKRAQEFVDEGEFERLDVPLTENATQFLAASRRAYSEEQEQRLAELEATKKAAEENAARDWSARVEAEQAARKAAEFGRKILLTGMVAAIGVLLIGWWVWNGYSRLATKYESYTKSEPERIKEAIKPLEEKTIVLEEQKVELQQDAKLLQQQTVEVTETLLNVRPVITLEQDRLPPAEQLPDAWRERLSERSKEVELIAKSVGMLRVGRSSSEGLQPPGSPVGTAFVIGPNLVMTMGFVLEAAHSDEYNPKLDLEFGSQPDGEIYPVAKVMYRSVQGLVVLEVPNLNPSQHPPLALSQAATTVGQEVAMFGFPFRDNRTPEFAVREIFKDVFGVKRMMIGQVTKGDTDEIVYDAWGAPGCSGSPIVDIATWSVVGVHSGGRVNPGETAQELKRESYGVSMAHIQSQDGFLKLQASGYAADFLAGVNIPLPVIPPQFIGDLLDGKVINSTHYSLAIHEGRRMPFYVAYNIDRDRLQQIQRTQENSQFLIDPRVPEVLQLLDTAYRNNDFDRGHLARPSALAWGSESQAKVAYQDAFYYTNAVPQLSTFNQREWMKLEDYELETGFPESRRISVLTGPVFRRDDLEYRGMRVPRSYWKIIVGLAVDGLTPQVDAFLLNQYEPLVDETIDVVDVTPVTDVPFQDSRTTVTEIEKLTGLDFGVLKTMATPTIKD